MARINDATQAVRYTRGELDAGVSFRLPGGNLARFYIGDLVLIRRNDCHQQAVTGDAVLNGYRGVVTAITPTSVEVEWHDPAAEATAPPSRAVLSAGYIAQDGLELGYVCPPVVGNVLVYLDNNHTSATIVTTLSPIVERVVPAVLGW